MLVRWSHCYDMQLMGVGNSIKLTVPLYCMRSNDELIIQSVKYKSNELHIAADILRRPFLSQYLEMERFEPVSRSDLRDPPQLR